MKNSMTDAQWDSLLGVRTTGRDDSHSDQYRFPYEPTPYAVLERLAGSGFISKHNTVVDYGCGKGRACFFLSWQLRCRCIGIEYDERICGSALLNLENAAYGRKTEFINTKAEDYPVPPEADRFFFFNPFSVEILQRVVRRIRESWYERQREIVLFFYYPSDEYISWLMTAEELLFSDEIDCEDLFDDADSRERILVFEMV